MAASFALVWFGDIARKGWMSGDPQALMLMLFYALPPIVAATIALVTLAKNVTRSLAPPRRPFAIKFAAISWLLAATAVALFNNRSENSPAKTRSHDWEAWNLTAIERNGAVVEIAVKNPKLRAIYLETPLLQVAGSLESLEVRREGLDTLSDILPYLARLEALTCDGTPMNQRTTSIIQQLTKLKKLALRNVRLGSDEMRVVAGLATLEQLEISKSTVDPAAYGELERSRSITALRLRDVAAGDAELNAIRRMAPLRECHFYGTKVTPAGARSLRAARPDVNFESD